MSDVSESPKGYHFPKLVIGHAVYLYHRLPISYCDVQELLFKRGINVSQSARRQRVRDGQGVVPKVRSRYG